MMGSVVCSLQGTLELSKKVEVEVLMSSIGSKLGMRIEEYSI